MQDVSPTVYRTHVIPHQMGAALMETMAQEQHAAMVAEIHKSQTPTFAQAYWAAFCEAHPKSAKVVAYLGWLSASLLASCAVGLWMGFVRQ